MKVETYEIEEIKGEAGTMAADSEAIELCEKLGLSGQLSLANTETGTRCPYPKLTAVQAVVFHVICPITTRLENYNSGIIPLRVLQVAAFCKENHLFDWMEVWHPKDAKLDPVLIGCVKHPSYDNVAQEQFLLARWAEAWKDFDVLALEAKEIIRAKLKSALSKSKAEVDAALASVDALADEVIATGTNKNPAFWM